MELSRTFDVGGTVGGGTKIDEDIDLCTVAFSCETVPGGVVFFWCPFVTIGGAGGGGGVGVGRCTMAGGGEGGFNAIAGGASFGSEMARVFELGNWVVITTGFVVLFGGNVGIGAGLTALPDDDLTDEFGVVNIGGLKDELNSQEYNLRRKNTIEFKRRDRFNNG